MATKAEPVNPTLDGKGWVTAPNDLLDVAFSDFMMSDYSQSSLFYGQIASLPYLIAQCGQDLLRLKQEVRSTLERHLGPYFDTVQVTVETIPNARGTPATELRCSMVVIKDGISYRLDRAVEDIRSFTLKMIEVTNGN